MVERRYALGDPMATETAERLVGRDAEMRRIERTLDGLGRRSAAVLAIVGEPGIGKTRLLSELEARAAGRDHLVLAGRAAEFERELPFAVVVDAIDRPLPSSTRAGSSRSDRSGSPSWRACSPRSATSPRPTCAGWRASATRPTARSARCWSVSPRAARRS